MLSAAVYEAQVLHSIMRVVGGAGRLAAHDVVGWVHSGRYHRSCFENRIRDAWWGSAQRLGATGAGASSPGKTAAPGRRKAPAAGAGVGSPCGVGAPPCPKLVAGPGQWWPWPRPRRLYPPPRFAGPVTLTPRLPRRLGQRHPVQGPPGSCGRRASRGGGGGRVADALREPPASATQVSGESGQSRPWEASSCARPRLCICACAVVRAVGLALCMLAYPPSYLSHMRCAIATGSLGWDGPPSSSTNVVKPNLLCVPPPPPSYPFTAAGVPGTSCRGSRDPTSASGSWAV